MPDYIMRDKKGGKNVCLMHNIRWLIAKSKMPLQKYRQCNPDICVNTNLYKLQVVNSVYVKQMFIISVKL